MKPTLIAAIVLGAFVNFATRSKARMYPTEPTQSADSRHPSALAPVSAHNPVNQEDQRQNATNITLNKSPDGEGAGQLILIIIAGSTAAFICWQAWESRKAAQSARAGIDLQTIAMQQWVETEDWSAGPPVYIPNAANAVGADLPITFKIRNQTKYKMTLHMVVLWINDRHKASIGFQSQLLPPERGFATASVDHRLTTAQVFAYRQQMLTFSIGGMIWYVDAFGRDCEQLFGFSCGCRESNMGVFEPIAFTPPNDVAWKPKQREGS